MCGIWFGRAGTSAVLSQTCTRSWVPSPALPKQVYVWPTPGINTDGTVFTEPASLMEGIESLGQLLSKSHPSHRIIALNSSQQPLVSHFTHEGSEVSILEEGKVTDRKDFVLCIVISVKLLCFLNRASCIPGWPECSV